MPYSVDIEAQEGLFLSAANGYTDILMFFIENGADINACTHVRQIITAPL